MKRALLALLTAALTLSAFAGCTTTTTTPDAGSPASEAASAADGGEVTPATDTAEPAAPAGDITIAMLPKFKGENYFDACKIGAQEAADELGINLLYDGPPQDQATNQKQVDILEGWIAQKVDVIILSPNDPTAIAPTLQKAQSEGIKVVTFDADAQEESRDLFINQITAEAAAKGLLDAASADLKAKGYGDDSPANIALVSSSGTDANQAAWEAAIDVLLAQDAYSFMTIGNRDTDVYYPGTDETTVNSECGTLISRMGPGGDQIQAAIGLTSMATPALGAQYQSASSKPDPEAISLTGLATPNALKTYIKDDTNPLNSGVLWSCMDLGYLAVQAAQQLVTGEITPDSSSVNAGRLGTKEIGEKVCVLGDALVFDVATVDNYDY